MPLGGENSKAHPAAYSGESMYFRKPMPAHSDWEPVDFYFKQCTEVDSKVHYSKTSYECEGGF